MTIDDVLFDAAEKLQHHIFGDEEEGKVRGYHPLQIWVLGGLINGLREAAVSIRENKDRALREKYEAAMAEKRAAARE